MGRSLKTALLALVAVAASALLAVTCYGWLRSWQQTDDITWHTTGRMTRLRTSGGGFWFETRPWDVRVAPHTEWQQFTDATNYPIATDRSSPFWQRCGFMMSRQGYDLLVVAPYWFVVGGLVMAMLLSVAGACRK